jgi:hypothetical protein
LNAKVVGVAKNNIWVACNSITFIAKFEKIDMLKGEADTQNADLRSLLSFLMKGKYAESNFAVNCSRNFIILDSKGKRRVPFSEKTLLSLQYMLPFILNQCGSVLYYITLGSSGKLFCIMQITFCLLNP